MNTSINFVYRGRSYRTLNRVIVAGEFTKEQKDRIINSLYDETSRFVPVQVGLTAYSSGRKVRNANATCQLRTDEFYYTTEEPTDNRTIEELARAFEKAKEEGWAIIEKAAV